MPSLLEQVDELVVEELVHLLDRHAVCIGAQRNRRAVRVRAGNHQHVISFQTVVAGNDIPRQVRAGQVAHVDGGIGIRPGNGDEDGFGGHEDLLS